jgi:hypothetical protein
VNWEFLENKNCSDCGGALVPALPSYMYLKKKKQITESPAGFIASAIFAGIAAAVCIIVIFFFLTALNSPGAAAVAVQPAATEISPVAAEAPEDTAVVSTAMPVIAGLVPEAADTPAEPQPITAEDWYGVAPVALDERLQGLYIPTIAEVVMAAKMTWGESRGIWSLTEQAADIWCSLNRVDSKGYAMGHSLTYVITFPDQFHGYNPGHPTVDDYGRDITVLAVDVITRWLNEKLGFEDVGRVLPPEYLWFSSNKNHTHNIFRDQYSSRDPACHKWGWSLPSPYDS